MRNDTNCEGKGDFSDAMLYESKMLGSSMIPDFCNFDFFLKLNATTLSSKMLAKQQQNICSIYIM